MKLDVINPYTFKTGVVLFLGFVLGQIIISIIAALSIFILKVDYEASPLFLLLAYTLTMVSPIFLYDYLVLKPESKHLKFNFTGKPISVYLIVFLMMFGMMLMVEYIVGLIPTTGFFFGEAYRMFNNQIENLAMDHVSMIILTVILAPILEEVLFRGILQKSIVNKGINPMVAIVISSFIFGAIHGYPWQFVGGFFLSLILGLVYHKTKTLLLPILLHAFNNLISALLLMSGNLEGLYQMIGVSPILSFLLGLLIFGLSFYMFFFRKAIIFGE